TICNSAAPSAKGDDKFITTDYLQQCPSACLGEISGGRINGGASPPFVRVKAEDSSLKNIRL
ncbi:hypothetical protein ACJEKM_25070, partial [Escherichia coli]